MSHFGVLSYKGAGHLNPLIALSRQLVARGHRVTFIQSAELEDHVRAHGLEFCSIGSLGARPARCGGRGYRWQVMRDIVALRDGIDRIIYDMEFFLRQAPGALVAAGIDTLIMDEIALAGTTLAEMLRLPYFVVSTSVPHNFGWDGPPGIAAGTRFFERVQHALLQVSVVRMRGPVRRRLDKFRRSRGFGSIRRIQSVYPELAHITQLPRCLDFPQAVLPRNFHYAGPFVDETARPAMDFAWDRLDGRTMVYASLGTSRRSDLGIFHLIAEACAELRLQLVISLGGRRDPESLSGLPGEPVVVRYLPQLEVLKRADIVISHGGLNTTLETLREGKPMIVIPKAFDQPAVAARLKWCGVAEVLSMKELSANRILGALRRILNEPGYRDSAMKLHVAIRSSRGLEHAADVIEESLRCMRWRKESC
ncbi:MAG: glycosyltransferase, family [Edaphobacter sp.]|nr:glycosyltransferase, family [Edaphobacter sp.]